MLMWLVNFIVSMSFTLRVIFYDRATLKKRRRANDNHFILNVDYVAFTRRLGHVRLHRPASPLSPI